MDLPGGQHSQGHAAATKRSKVQDKQRSTLSAVNLPCEIWPMLAEVLLKDLIARLTTDKRKDEESVQLELAQQLRSVSLLYTVNKDILAMIRAVYVRTTRALRKQAAVRKACYNALTAGAEARWQRANPGMGMEVVTPELRAQRGWPVLPPGFVDPLDMMFRDMITTNTTVRLSILANSDDDVFNTSHMYKTCKPFSSNTMPSKFRHAIVWPPVHPVHVAQSVTTERMDMFQWVQEHVKNTCNVCHAVTKETGMGGSTIGRVCKGCQRGTFVEISTLCTVYGIYQQSPNGVDWNSLRLSKLFNNMNTQQVRALDQRASMLVMPQGERRPFQFVDMRSVYSAVSTAEDPTGEATLQVSLLLPSIITRAHTSSS